VTRAMDPTSRGDIIASVLRQWYERNRETWWDRHKPGIMGAGPDRAHVHADEFMLALINKVREIDALSDMELVRDYS
jgi:hypothetical protein